VDVQPVFSSPSSGAFLVSGQHFVTEDSPGEDSRREIGPSLFAKGRGGNDFLLPKPWGDRRPETLIIIAIGPSVWIAKEIHKYYPDTLPG
jgi:hypothetical protein